MKAIKVELYVFGMNYNPAKKEDEPVLTEIRIPAKSREEAYERLNQMIQLDVADKFTLLDVRDY